MLATGTKYDFGRDGGNCVLFGPSRDIGSTLGFVVKPPKTGETWVNFGFIPPAVVAEEIDPDTEGVLYATESERPGTR